MINSILKEQITASIIYDKREMSVLEAIICRLRKIRLFGSDVEKEEAEKLLLCYENIIRNY